MSSNQENITAVPTNIITGFLGVGKTSAILHLLKTKPDEERWAVLVNEFGEIGIDGDLFEGKHSEQQGVFIREVPGGCMCCAAGLPMQIALNQLLSRAKPQRLLIEPTGLGHPKEVLQTLSQPHYQGVLSLHKILTLVDARKLSDERYTENPSFNQQIAIGDVIIGNKLDLYNAQHIFNLENYVKQKGAAHAKILFTQEAKIEASTLNGATAAKVELPHHHHHPSEAPPLVAEQALPECGYLKAENNGEGFHSVGWRFSADKIFDRQRLYHWVSGLKVERAKGVFITREGIFAYNVTSDATTEMELDDCLESQIEIISESKDLVKEEDLLACIVA